MTFSTKFTALDNREAARLDVMTGQDRLDFDRLRDAHHRDFQPEGYIEEDVVYCLVTLRHGIDRNDALVQGIEALCAKHSYMPSKVRVAVNELAAYRTEMGTRYEYFFAQLSRLQNTRRAKKELAEQEVTSAEENS